MIIYYLYINYLDITIIRTYYYYDLLLLLLLNIIITLIGRAGGNDMDSQLAPLAPIADRRCRWGRSARHATGCPGADFRGAM